MEGRKYWMGTYGFLLFGHGLVIVGLKIMCELVDIQIFKGGYRLLH